MNRPAQVVLVVAAGTFAASCVAVITSHAKTPGILAGAGAAPPSAQAGTNPSPEPPAVVTPATGTAVGRLSVLDGVYTEAQAARGETAFQQACARCHLADLSGDGVAPPLSGPMFHLRWDEAPLAEMFLTIRERMPHDAPGSLSNQVYADICAYILKANDYPPGKIEVGHEMELLRRIYIDRVPAAR